MMLPSQVFIHIFQHCSIGRWWYHFIAFSFYPLAYPLVNKSVDKQGSPRDQYFF
jgi:hypothetical protein